MRWVWDQAHGIYSESGELLFIDGYLSDIAARKKAEEESLSALRTLQVFVDSVPGHVSFVDAGGLYRLVNPGYEEWFGRSRDEIVGRHLDEMHSRQSSEGEVLGFFALVLGVTGRRLRLHVRQ